MCNSNEQIIKEEKLELNLSSPPTSECICKTKTRFSTKKFKWLLIQRDCLILFGEKQVNLFFTNTTA